MAEYMLTDKCENANYGSNVAGDMVDFTAASYISAMNALFNKGRGIYDPAVYIIQSNYTLNFGTGSNPTPFTIAMFNYVQTASGAGPNIQFGTTAVSGRWTTWTNCEIKFVFLYYNNEIRFSYCNPPSSFGFIVISLALPTANWYHLALTYDGTYIKTYVNGVFHSANPLTITTTSLKVYGFPHSVQIYETYSGYFFLSLA